MRVKHSKVLSIICLAPCPACTSSAQAFHEVAYQAESRDELLQAINLFLDDSIVLPPGDWDQKTLLPIMDMARKRAQVRRRNKRKEKTGEAFMWDFFVGLGVVIAIFCVLWLVFFFFFFCVPP